MFTYAKLLSWAQSLQPGSPSVAAQDLINILNGFIAHNNISLANGGLFSESSVDNILAHAGGGQANATPLTSEVNRITTVASANDSVILPASQPGLTLMVINHAANSVQVFGAGTDTIDDIVAATGVTQSNGSVVFYTCATQGAWYSEGLATGYSGSLQTFSSLDNITAYTSGGQTNATLLTYMMNRVTGVGASNASVILPASARGLDITVTNANATNALAVFAQGSDIINSLSANTAFSLGVGKSVQFISYTAGQWHTLPLVP